MAGWRARACAAGLIAGGLLALVGSLRADPPPTLEGEVLTLEKAVAWTLQFSPELAVVRRQRGIAAANVVIARTYPFNPIWQSFTMAANGPTSAGVTNRVFVENTFRLDLELCGQGKFRTGAANAAASRTEWEIAVQELALGVRAMRAFNTFVYRQEKMRLVEDSIKLQERTVEQANQLADQGKLRPVDVMFARSDLVEVRAQRGPSQAALVIAWNDLKRTIGVEMSVAHYVGSLDAKVPALDAETLTPRALQMRPDLHALQQAIMEADQRVRLERANRFGNPSIGPAMEYNETSVVFVGAWLVYPLPVLNTRRGDIMLREAERNRVIEDRHRVEIQTRLDVQAALARTAEAQRGVQYFATEALPALQTTLDSLDKLFAAADPNVDLLRIIDARRRLQRGRDGYLDALWELSQARADLVAAVGDLGLAVEPVIPVTPVCEPAAQLLAPVPQKDSVVRAP